MMKDFLSQNQPGLCRRMDDGELVVAPPPRALSALWRSANLILADAPLCAPDLSAAYSAPANGFIEAVALYPSDLLPLESWANSLVRDPIVDHDPDCWSASYQKRRWCMDKLRENTWRECFMQVARNDRKVGEPVRLSSTVRRRLIGDMERCLVNTNRLKAYVRDLEDVIRGPFPFLGSPSGLAYEFALERGLDALCDRDLIFFSLSGKSMQELRVEIREKHPRHWREVARRLR